MNQGRWWGSIQEAQFCVTDGCLVWPRSVAAVEQIAVCGYPIASAGPWYQFTRNLATLRQCACSSTSNACGSCSCGHMVARARAGTVASFATTIGSNKLIRSYPGSGADVGKAIIYQGRDANGVWVRTLQDGVMADGERVLLSLPFVDTTTVWGAGSPVAVVKEATAARVLVYEYDTVTALERALAEYEPGETRPSYRVSYLPGLTGEGGCCDSGCGCTGSTTTKTVTALVKLQHVDVASPGDWLVLQNLEAYQAAMVAVKAREEKDYAAFNFEFYGTPAPSRNARGPMRVVNRAGAIPLLQAELRTMSSDRVNIYAYGDETDKFARMTLGFR